MKNYVENIITREMEQEEIITGKQRMIKKTRKSDLVENRLTASHIARNYTVE
jgi:hypothetical protein